jgi:hypothetical protein
VGVILFSGEAASIYYWSNKGRRTTTKRNSDERGTQETNTGSSPPPWKSRTNTGGCSGKNRLSDPHAAGSNDCNATTEYALGAVGLLTIIFASLAELLWSLAVLIGDQVWIFWHSAAFFPL